MKKLTLTLVIIFGLITFPGQSLAWHDKTHLAVAKVAGYEAWYNAAGADIAKIKAGDKERFNHWYNNNRKEEVTAKIVLDQVAKYNRAYGWFDAEDHLLGAIIGALREYEKYSTLACPLGYLNSPEKNVTVSAGNKAVMGVITNA